MSRVKTPPISRLGNILWAIIQEHPGIHFRGLGRAAHIRSGGQLRHHLDRLESRGVVVEIEEGGYKRFFAAGAQDPKLRAQIARYSRHVTHLIGVFLLDRPMTRTDLRKNLGCADSTLGFHLAHMLTQGELERTRDGNHRVYQLKDKDLVRKALLLQQDNGTPPVVPPQQIAPKPEEHNGHVVPITAPAPAQDGHFDDPPGQPFQLDYVPPDADLLREIAPAPLQPDEPFPAPRPLVSTRPIEESRPERKEGVAPGEAKTSEV